MDNSSSAVLPEFSVFISVENQEDSMALPSEGAVGAGIAPAASLHPSQVLHSQTRPDLTSLLDQQLAACGQGEARMLSNAAGPVMDRSHSSSAGQASAPQLQGMGSSVISLLHKHRVPLLSSLSTPVARTVQLPFHFLPLIMDE